MSRILGVDFGKRRVGLAVTDPLQIIASPMITVQFREAINYIYKYCTTEDVEAIVIGQPRRMSGELSDLEQDILKFIIKLQRRLPDMKIARYDERFTSKIAARSLIESGVKKSKRRDKSLLDSTSASLILQDYLLSIQ